MTGNVETFTYNYDMLSRRSNLQRPNGVTTFYDYDQVNRLVRLKHQNANNLPMEDFQYSFNADEEISNIKSLYSQIPLPISTINSVADNDNQISQFGNDTFTFNNVGQTLTKTTVGVGTTHYEWDHRGRLIRVILPNNQEIKYTYDAVGRRASRTVNSSSLQFFYDGWDVVMDVVGINKTDYLNGKNLDEKLQLFDSSLGKLSFLQDHLESTIALVGTDGTITERNNYDPFGQSSLSSLTRYGFTGKESDNLSGLLYYRARWYDPSQNRFLTEDLIGSDDSPNFYIYALNNPINKIDPYGLRAYDEKGGTICNKLSGGKCLIVAQDTSKTGKGDNGFAYDVLPSGKCTDPGLDFDSAYVDGQWFKCRNGFVCSVFGRGAYYGWLDRISSVPKYTTLETFAAGMVPFFGGGLQNNPGEVWFPNKWRGANYIPTQDTNLPKEVCEKLCDCNKKDNVSGCNRCKENCLAQNKYYKRRYSDFLTIFGGSIR